MKVTIEDRKPKKLEWEYPCLGKHRLRNYIVLFSDCREGIVVQTSDDTAHKDLYIKTDWIMTNFIPQKWENKRIAIDC